MNVAKHKHRVVGRAAKAPLTLLKPALAFKEDGSTCIVHIAFVEEAVGELIAVNGDFFIEERSIVKDGHEHTLAK